MILGLYNFFITSDNVKKLSAFYTKTLHLKVHHDCPRCVVFDMGNGQYLVILEPQGTLKAKAKGEKPAAAPAGLIPPIKSSGFGLRVDDVNAVYKKLKDDFKFSEEPQDEYGIRRTLTGFDPEGNKVNFIEEKTKAAR